MLTAYELRGLVAPSLHGSRRVVRDGKDQPRISSDTDRARYRRWYLANREAKLAYQSAYGKQNRGKVNAKVLKWVKSNPERIKQLARAKFARVYAKKKAMRHFMLLHVSYAAVMSGGQK